ncbi:T9SS type A sorting domain-containing protein [Flammeovirga aprica]|uniref:T9SS type A sorting domain-containing protein n=1 Tax=Flammeovirga aprica JL-4 TaxID=694437 RepID=A0A7X9S0Y9_9BACT|nr:T9SS type A sorting domain-containing protein [Flammeovirga aprica]NME72353.1 T9SS type A sorting domain-containing protein [Flammeovirga aprica JL-4]
MKNLRNILLLTVMLFSGLAVNASDRSNVAVSENEPIHVYPIPANTQFHIDFKNNQYSDITYKLVNLESGLSTVIDNKNSISHQISSFDVSLLPTGTYMLVIEENGKSIYTKKMVINHFGV